MPDSPPAVETGRATLLLTIGAAALLVAQQVASKATRDALFLVSFEPRRLPLAMGCGAVLSFLLALVVGRALVRFPPRRVVQAGLLLHASLFVVELLLSARSPTAVAVLLYLHVAGFGSVLISAFWSLVSDGVDPHRARSRLARIAAGAALGGVLGGLAARGLAGIWGGRATLLVLAIASAACALLLERATAAPRDAPASPEPAPTRTPVSVLLGSPYLRSLATLGVLVAVWEGLLEFAMKNGAAAAMHDPQTLVSFFAVFYTATSVLTFAVQLTFGRIALRRGGVGATLAMLPAIVTGGLAAIVGAPFPLVLGLQAGESVVASSVFRSAYEVLFTPLPAATKRSTKTLLDVGAARIGDGLGAALVLAIVTWWPDLTARLPLIASGVLGLAGVLLVRQVARRYVETLGSALRAGTVALALEPHVDATTRRTLQATSAALERERARGGLAERFETLCHGTPERMRRVLATPLEPELVRAALPLLAHPDVAADALRALRDVASANVGTLTDALVDEHVPIAVRVRIPRVLSGAEAARAAASLRLGVALDERAVRYHCARGLARLVAKDSAFAPPPDVLLAAVRRELDEAGLSPQNAIELAGDEATELDELVSVADVRPFAATFTLLSMVVDSETLQLVLRGLTSGDDRLRGTALELLENVLPDDLRAPVVAAFSHAGRAQTKARSRAEILAELSEVARVRAEAAR